jgi:hypothetical protein
MRAYVRVVRLGGDAAQADSGDGDQLPDVPHVHVAFDNDDARDPKVTCVTRDPDGTDDGA